LATVNNLVYVYNSTKGVWNKANVAAPLAANTISISGNITTTGNLNITGNIDTAGSLNVSGRAVLGSGTTSNVVIAATTTTTSTTTGALIVRGGTGISGNLTVGNILTISGNIAQSALQINGTATRGGAGFHDFLSATNQGGGTNPNKWFRITSTGTLEIINSAYTAAIFGLTDAGNLSIGGALATSSRGISAASVPPGSVLQVVQTAMPTTLYSSSGNTGVLDVTNFSTTFTPLYNNSRVFHIISIGLKFICDGRVFIKRGGTVVSPSLADQWREITWDATVDMGISTMHWLDSPATASQITYQLAVQASGCSATIAVGSSGDFTPYWTLMEIAV
jgi:hypothetical protein